METPKVIADPICGIIDIRPVLPMVETREFQALGDKRQLGMTYLVFPSATHTRKTHSLGAYQATRELTERWVKRGFINSAEGEALAGYALYHDIGHPALSHVTESLCPAPLFASVKNAAGRALSKNAALSFEIIERRRKEIEACGIDFSLMRNIALHANPLFQAVSDKNLGMEKLDYLERDGLFTILSRPVGVDYLRHHIYFIDGAIAIDEKVTDNAIEIQNYYLKIYKNVYLRKTSAIAQRMVQKMVSHLIQAGELNAEDLVNLTDSELFGIMYFSQNTVVRTLYDLLRNRDIFREGIVIRPEQFAGGGARPGKRVITLGASEKEMRRLAKNPTLNAENQAGLESVEEEIAAIAGIPPHLILVTPIHGEERFEAQDIMIYQGPGKKLASLKARYPAHFRNIAEVGQTYIAFRVCTTEEYRATLATPKIAKKVFELLLAQK